MKDLIIIGGGPAGIAAGVYAARKRLTATLIATEIGGQSVVSEGIENWIGTPKIAGTDLAKSFAAHIEALKGDIVELALGETVAKLAETAGGFTELLNLFLPKVGIEELPLLPHLANGRPERLLLSLNRGTTRLVLRLWPTRFRLAETGTPLWIGTVTSERPLHVADLLTLPKKVGDYEEAQRLLAQTISPISEEAWRRRHVLRSRKTGDWSGGVLLAVDTHLARPKR